MAPLLDRDELHRLQVSAVQLASNGIIITDPEGRILWANHAFTQISGYALKDVIGRDTRLLKSGRQPQSYYAAMWSTISSGKFWSGELINRRKDGRHYHEEMSITPIVDAHGKITHYIAIKRDVTIRKTAEDALNEALRRLEEQYRAVDKARSQTRAVMDATGEAILLLSMDRKFVVINRAFERFFAVDEEELVGRDVDELRPHFQRVFQHPSGLPDLFAQAHRTDDNGNRMTITQNWPLKRELEIYTTLVGDVLGEEVGVLYVFRDVTREREVERLKSEFVSLISHELRTPLTSIEGYVDLLLDGDGGDLEEMQIEFLQVVKRNADRLTKLVTDLLDVSRIEAGAVKLNWTTFDVNVVIKDVINDLRTHFESKHQGVTLTLGGKTAIINGDPEYLTRVFANLLSNAYKYTPVDGTITVKTWQEGNRVRIDVQDTGIGISEDDQSKLFTKFFRSQDSEAQNMSGAGLGLWISRSLVEMHSGDLSFTSVLGKGSTFSVRLPLK